MLGPADAAADAAGLTSTWLHATDVGDERPSRADQPPSPQAHAIVVWKELAITSVAQLKGRKVAFFMGAGAHELLLEALAQAGLSTCDAEPAYPPWRRHPMPGGMRTC